MPDTSRPPEVMTWPKAAPVLAVAGVFYVLRLFFEWFVFFAPVLAAAVCAETTSSYLSWLGSLGTSIATSLCVGGAAALGVVGSEVSAGIGLLVAPLIGFAGALAVGLTIILTGNLRLFEEPDAALWLFGGFVVSEIPFVGSVPSIFGAVLRLYASQIERDKKTLLAWKKRQEAALAQQRRAQQEQLLQLQQMQAAEAEAAA